MHSYGFGLFDNPHTRYPTSLEDFFDLCLVAALYEIHDLLHQALEAGTRALADCSSGESEEKVENALKVFLGSDDPRLKAERHSKFAHGDHALHTLKIVGGHFTQLCTKPLFKKLLDEEPKLAHLFLDELAKDQAPKKNSETQ